MLSEQNPRGATLARRASIFALILTAGVTGSVLAASGTYHTATVAAVSLRTKLVAGKTYTARVAISHTEGVSVDVDLAGSNLTVPGTVTVPAGARTTTFQVTAGSAGAASLSAMLNGSTKTKNLTVSNTKLKDVAFNPSQIVGGGADAAGSVLLASISNSAFAVDLSSDDPRLDVPAGTLVGVGQSRSAYFDVSAPAGVDNPVTANVTADVNGTSVDGAMTILPAVIRFEKLGDTTVAGGRQQVLVIVELNGRAGPSGKSYAVNSSDTSLVPNGTLVVAPNAKRGTLRLATTDVSSNQNVTLTIPGQPGMQVTLTP